MSYSAESSGPREKVGVLIKMCAHFALARLGLIGFAHDRIDQAGCEIAAYSTVDDGKAQIERPLDEISILGVESSQVSRGPGLG